MSSKERIFTKVFKKLGFTIYANWSIQRSYANINVGFSYEVEYGIKTFSINLIFIELCLFTWGGKL